MRARAHRTPLAAVVSAAMLVAAPRSEGTPELASAKPTLVRERSTAASEGIDGIQGLRATFHVAAAPDRVLAVLWDVRRFPDMFPDIKHMRVLSRGETEIDVEFRVDAVIAEVTYTLRRTLDKERRSIRWHEIAGDLEHVRGSWLVENTADPNLSRVTYASFVSVNAFVPESVYRNIAEGKVEELAGRLRRAVEESAPKGASGQNGRVE